ncbi:MAG: hypothetical protein ACJA08_000998 [Cyclobacteriaceae bacterium]|jgi:hypothetical protein
MDITYMTSHPQAMDKLVVGMLVSISRKIYRSKGKAIRLFKELTGKKAASVAQGVSRKNGAWVSMEVAMGSNINV